ncbi:hypothetical protein ABPG75_005958 [Micractinium tetrahymenae]
MGESYPLLLWLSTAACLLGSVQFGYHIGVLNTAEQYVEADLGAGQQGAALVGVLIAAATFGSLAAGSAADRFGPRTAGVLNNALLLAGTACSMCAGRLLPMLLGRALAGLGCGAASVLVPRYLAEIAPLAIRGALGTLTQVFINVGILAAYLVGYPYEAGATSVQLLGHEVAWWRIMFAAVLGPALLQAASLALCPESPAWLLRAGRADRAARALRRLHGSAFRPEDHHPKVQAAAAAAEGRQAGAASGTSGLADAEQPLLGSTAGQPEGQAEDQAEQEHLGWGALWAPRYRRVMVLAAALPLAQQASGINTVIFFSTQVFQQAGLQSPILGSIAMGLTNVAFTVVAALLMDHAGRRPLLLTSFAGMAACLAALAAVMQLPTPKALEGPASLGCVLAYMVFFALGAGPIPYLYMPEVLPREIMGTAQAFCTSLNWLSNLVVGSTFPALLAALGIAGSYLVYAVLNVAAFLFLEARMVETKRRSADSIRAQLLGETGGA